MRASVALILAILRSFGQSLSFLSANTEKWESEKARVKKIEQKRRSEKEGAKKKERERKSEKE